MKPEKYEYDAVVVGSGPNGLAAAILMQQYGQSVLLLEGQQTIGGGMRSAEITLPGFLSDICSAVHPLAVCSPFFAMLPLEKYGLEYIYPGIAAAHPFDDGSAAFLKRAIADTADQFGADRQAYLRLMQPAVEDWKLIAPDAMGPLDFPAHPFAMARFGIRALRSASSLAERFSTARAKGLFAGMAAHSMQPLSNLSSAATAMILMSAGHLKGWPMPKGGSGQIAAALASLFISLGGVIQTGTRVSSLEQLPKAKAVLFDITPRQLLAIAGHQFSNIYKWQLQRYRYGMGIYKMDWALEGAVPFTNEHCRQAGTVHLGNTIDQIAASEQLTWDGGIPEKPFVLMAQQSLFDPSRAPEGKQAVWAYCHVPNSSTVNMTDAIEKQVERFAPGFRDRILARHVFDARQIEEYNPNYIGGDIGGGAFDLGQLFTRPALRWSPYRSSAKGLYICSASTPPGGGVHGMCGYHAAKRALKDIFNISVKPPSAPF